MLLAKTEKTKLMLSQRDSSLGAKDRQILILCSGTRTYDELVEMLGREIEPLLNRFIGNGLLVDVSRALRNDSGAMSQTGTFYSSELQNLAAKVAAVVREKPVRTSSTPSQLMAVSASTDRDVIPTASQGAPVSLSSRGKRSIAASKMYMINLLQMHRDLDASTLAVNIHTSENEQQLVASVFASLRFVTNKAGLPYGMRVAEQLSNILPEIYLPSLREFTSENLTEQPSILVS